MAKKKTVNHLFPELATVKVGDQEYTVHQLTNRGTMVLLRMLAKMSAVIDLGEVFSSVGKESDTGANITLFMRLLSVVPLVEQQVYDLLALLLKVEKDVVPDFPPSATLDVMTAFFNQEDVEGLLHRFFALFGSLRPTEIIGQD